MDGMEGEEEDGWCDGDGVEAPWNKGGAIKMRWRDRIQKVV